MNSMIGSGDQIKDQAPDSIEQLLKAMRGAIRAATEMLYPTSQLAARYRELRLPIECADEQTLVETIRQWSFALVRARLIDLDPRQLSRDQRHKKRDALKIIKLMALCRSYNLAQDEIDRRHDDTISGEDLSKLYAKPEEIWSDWQRLTSNDSVVLNADERRRVFAWFRVTYNVRSDAWNTRVREAIDLVWGRHARRTSNQFKQHRSSEKSSQVLPAQNNAEYAEPVHHAGRQPTSISIPKHVAHAAERLPVSESPTASANKSSNDIGLLPIVQRAQHIKDKSNLSPVLATSRSVIFEGLLPGLHRLWASYGDYLDAMAHRGLVTLSDAAFHGLQQRLESICPKTDASLALDIAQRMTYRQVYYKIDPKTRVDPDCPLGNDSTLNRPLANKKHATTITLLTQINFLRRDHKGHYSFAQPAMVGLLATPMWRKILLDDGLSALSTKPRFYGAIALSAPVLDDLTLILLFERMWNQHFPTPEFAWMRAHILEEQSKVIYSKTTAQVLGWCVASLSPIAQQHARDLIRVVAGLLLFEIRSDLLHPMLAPVSFYESLLLLKAIAVEELTRLLDEMAKLVRTGIADRSRFNRAHTLLDANLPFIFSKRWLITNGLMQTQNNLGHEIRQRLTQISQQIRQHDEQHKKRGIFAA